MSDETILVDLAQELLLRGGVLQSTTDGQAIAPARIQSVLEQRISDEISHVTTSESLLTAQSAAAAAIQNAQRAIEKRSNLTDLEYASLQAIIEVTGRPAIRFDNGRVRMPPDLGENEAWRVLVAVARSKINTASSSVGRISHVDAICGTGWRTGGAVVVTNRHVLEELVIDRTLPPDQWRLDHARQPSIDFAATDNAASPRQFAIEAIEYCADKGDVDIAILRIASGAGLPPALSIHWKASFDAKDVRKVYVVGHPFRTFGSELITAIYGVADGLKRWSPGYVTRVHDDQPHFDHDCSTLGGNSGSCVLTASEHSVAGLHFAGVGVDALTGRGASNIAISFSKLVSHKAAGLLGGAEKAAHG